MLQTPDLSLVYILVIFGLSYLVLKSLVFRPVVQILEEREKEVRTAADLHETALEHAKSAVANAEEKLSIERREISSGRNRLRNDGQAERQKKIEAARAEAEKALRLEREALERQIPSLRDSLKSQAEALAADVEARIMGGVAK
jgi:F-type H+-transporting ATPase subunit b